MTFKKQEKPKSWFRAHPILNFFLALFLIGLIFGSDNQQTLNSEEQRTTIDQVNSQQITTPLQASVPKQTTQITRDYITEDLNELWIYFVSTESPYTTELQKKEKFKEYEGKWLKSSGIISSVDEGLISGVTVRLLGYDNPYLSSASLYFDESDKSKLLKYNQYDEIQFEGKIEDYNSLLGIIIKDAKLI